MFARLGTSLLLLCALAAFGDEASTAARLEAIRNDPVQLRMFLQRMPKGGDLHNHLSGSVYAESFLRLGAKDGVCIDREALAFAPCNTSSQTQVPASSALTNPRLYSAMVNSLSMRDFRGEGESGHDHFFAAFVKFSTVARLHVNEDLAEVVDRLASEEVQYLESLFSHDFGTAAPLGERFTSADSYASMHAALRAKGVPEVVKGAMANIDAAEKALRDLLHCEKKDAKPGCDSTVRFLFETHRANSRERLFAELVVGFELASADPRVVGINVVQPEDSYASLSGFGNLMDMLAFLRPLYPARAHVSLHAGELAPGSVPPEDLRFHINDSVRRGKAERIGHGVDIAYETNADALLETMADPARPVAVEVCLTSNDVILGVKGARHPLRLYLNRGVPVVLATDDAGVSRADMTTEWQRAVEEHGLNYAQLKRIARNSLQYSFLEGGSLWSDAGYSKYVADCADTKSANCTSFLKANAKAREQMRLEQKLSEFEN